jgi:hypothetical protein
MEFARKIFSVGVLIVVLLVIPFFYAFPDTFEVRQYGIAQQILAHNPLNVKELWRTVRSRYSFGVNNLLGSFDTGVDYSDPEKFFGYLFSRFPTYAVVYPTETYYYWTAVMADGKTLSGNMRLLDAQNGVLHIGYFDKNNPHDESSSGWVGDFGPAQGVVIEKIDPNTFDVTYAGKTIRFVLSDFVHDAPKKLTLLPEEDFVAQILDESGIRLFLLYNNQTNSFYFVLNEEASVNENLIEIKDRYLLGKTTSFVYYHDQNYDRKIMVGVSNKEIYNNSYYDGPFDQVPPRLPLKEKLEAAYPYVKYRGGIDEHGNFIALQGSRVAISPYYDYDDITELFNYLGRCNEEEGKSAFWSCLTYEWKKDFHKTLGVKTAPHALHISQGWPANHSGSISATWPKTHSASKSSTWTADFRP